MNVQIDVAGTDPQGRAFLTWASVKATARLLGADAAGGPVDVVLTSAGPVGGLVFDTVRSDSGTASLRLTLPADGSPVEFWIAGEFQRPSAAYGDAVVQVTDNNGGSLGSKAVMVRIRKNAATLPAAERDRFLAALGTLNAQGQGAYRDFRDMHTAATTREMHGNVGFLPWHRAFVLDLERSLQAIDATVAVPYWRFDQPAPAVFTADFMGAPRTSGLTVTFTPGHPLQHWVTDGQPGIVREPLFPLNGPTGVLTEAQTFALGDPGALFSQFHQMEGDPHGTAHTSFTIGISPISRITTAVRDPLFFLLHANVDRLWAKWQWLKHRANPADPDAFAPANPNRIGHRLADTMWPWNGDTNNPRPSTAPGGPFRPTAVTPAPGGQPTVESMFDHLALLGADPLGFAYDDVPFELPPTVVAGGP